ncbi:MAG: uroporphyrinogen-III synthase [Chitinophagales bacterium]
MKETVVEAAKKNGVKSILISQPLPAQPEKSPYIVLGKKHQIKVDFRPFIQVEGIDVKQFRKYKISILDYSAIIFTSRNAIKHFFRICDDLRIKMPQETKYFCTSEAIALYLQKFILYRKRKVFFGKKGTVQGLKDILKKYKDKETFLFPCALGSKSYLPNFLTKNTFSFKNAPMYQTVPCDLSDLEDIFYDMIVFFSPLGLKSLYHNFPSFEQNDTRIAAFGTTTCKIVEEEYGLRLDIKAPSPGSPSMTMAIDKYIKEVNKKQA